MDDGTVKLEAQGTQDEIFGFIDALRETLESRAISLEIQSMDEIPVEKDSGFSII